MKIIYKSILKELILTFLLSLISLNFILMMEKLLKLSMFLSGVGTSLLDISKLIMYIQPQLFLLTIPMSLLLSTLLVYGRLYIDNELIILKNSGMDLWRISKPVLILGIACFLLNIAVSFYLGPRSSIKLREELIHIVQERTPRAIEGGRFHTSFKDILIIVREKISDNHMRGIFIYDSRNKKEPRVLVAKEGDISVQEGMNITFLLKDGYINISEGKNTTELFFNTYNMILKLETDTPSRKNSELTPFDIINDIPRSDRYRAIVLYTELSRRITLPLLCIILVFLGPPLSMMAGKSGKLGGLTIGLLVFTVYYMILIYSENLVKAEKIPFYIGTWIPTFLICTCALVLFKKESAR
jgi:lipopolysaccharide export system permease protein